MPYCTFCGKRLQPEANFCTKCGKPAPSHRLESARADAARGKTSIIVMYSLGKRGYKKARSLKRKFDKRVFK